MPRVMSEFEDLARLFSCLVFSYEKALLKSLTSHTKSRRRRDAWKSQRI